MYHCEWGPRHQQSREGDRSIQADKDELDISGLAWTRDQEDKTRPLAWPPVIVEERPRDIRVETQEEVKRNGKTEIMRERVRDKLRKGQGKREILMEMRRK